MHLQSVFPRAAVMAAVALLPLGACGASDPFPPAGLYEVRTSADIKYKGLDVSLAPLANQSGTLMTSKAAGKGTQQRILKGEAVPTVCLAAHKPNTGIGMPAGSCKGKPAVTGPDGTTFRVACGAMDMTTVVRKLDAKNWEYKVTTIEYADGAGAAGKPDFAMQKKMFEVTAKNGPTPEERAEAAKVLNNWAAYEAEMLADMEQEAKEEAAEAKQSGAAPAASPKVLRTSTAVTRLTSLGGSCTPVTGKLPQGG